MVYYISYYVDPKDPSKRIHSQAASGKVSYIARTLKELQESVEIVSLAVTARKKRVTGEKYTLSNAIGVKNFFSLGRGGKLKKDLNYLLIALQLLLYLRKSVKDGDIVIVYHSPATLWLSKLLCKHQRLSRRYSFLRKIRVILEVEEIYADVLGGNRAKEINGLQGANGYIIATRMLADEIMIGDTPYVVCHGEYTVYEPQTKASVFSDNKIHCVYAGTLQKGKGAIIAASAALHLTEDYHVHILGDGSAEEVRAIKSHVELVRQKSKASVTYDGYLVGEEFSRFLYSCSIGLVTQDINATYNKSSFPSKTLVYLAHGLCVVSADFDAINTSAVRDVIIRYYRQSPEAVAQAIQSINASQKPDGRMLLQKMDVDFHLELKKTLMQIWRQLV